MYFDELDLQDEILDALYDMQFTNCTPVQELAIPAILQNNDVIACAQTGTGKTAAYLLPLLSNLLKDNHDKDKINAIIMAPTRELAQQIDQQMEGFSYYLPFSSVAVYGGNDGNIWDIQKKGLTKGADVVIATPGRLLSHINVYNIDFSKVKYFILDEADRMLDMGFFDDIMKIVNLLPKERQTIMFSATMPNELRKIAKTFMSKPIDINIAISRPPETINQQAVILYENQKIPFVKHFLSEKKLKKVILFVGKKKNIKDIYLALSAAGITARQMHSDLTQKEREETMLDFRNNKIDVLVATNIVSRGIDVDDIPLVINFDVPKDVEDYIHRIGRTARAESDGEAITLVSEQDMFHFSKIEKFLKKNIDKLQLPPQFGDTPEYNPNKNKKAPKRPFHHKNKNKNKYKNHNKNNIKAN